MFDLCVVPTGLKAANLLLPLQGVGEQKSLEERLLVVETTEMSVNIAILVMEAVGSITSFVGFLPLGNRVNTQPSH